MIERLFPDVFLPRRLGADARQRMRIAQARAEEALIRTHVENALGFVETLAGEAGYERALGLYLQALEVPEPLASVVMMQALVALGDQLPEPRALVGPALGGAAARDGHREAARDAGRDAAREPAGDVREPSREPLREPMLVPSLRGASRRAS